MCPVFSYSLTLKYLNICHTVTFVCSLQLLLVPDSWHSAEARPGKKFSLQKVLIPAWVPVTPASITISVKKKKRKKPSVSREAHGSNGGPFQMPSSSHFRDVNIFLKCCLAQSVTMKQYEEILSGWGEKPSKWFLFNRESDFSSTKRPFN